MRLWLPAGLLMASTILAAGCATGQSSTTSGADSIAARQKLMKEQGAAMRSISNKMKAGQVQAVASDAETLATTARRIPSLFPPGSLDPDTSRAKPEIWQKRSEFEDTRRPSRRRRPRWPPRRAGGTRRPRAPRWPIWAARRARRVTTRSADPS